MFTKRNYFVGLSLMMYGHTATAGLISPGDIIVANHTGFSAPGSVIRIDPLTGQQEVISSGGFLENPTGIAVDINGDLLVADRGANFGGSGRLVRVNSVTGAQTVLSSGGFFVDPFGVAVAPNGNIFLADQNAGTGGTIFKVDRSSGVQSILSTGGSFVDPVGICFDSSGNLVVADPNGPGVNGAIINVDSVTGTKSILSQNGFFSDPVGITADPLTGNFYVADSFNFGSAGGSVIRVSPSGVQTVVHFGLDLFDPIGIAIGNNGNLIVSDNASQQVGGPKIVSVDAITGIVSTISANGFLDSPAGLVVYPEPTSACLLAFSAFGMFSRRRR